eukprot:TRINITY_DN4788_c0_g1_i2.p1 TRINITY_DN4788_c0_g1~~TRINITY_DN4788_c0_g1_i2.p1  ORF type:complete len:458 (+),score=77.04 TRINITY_DN4788_c0_g1_i2:160-1374(+)
MDEDIGYKCDLCDRVVPAQKQLTLKKCPPILTLQLKKFDYMGNKLNKSILFSDKIDVGPLISVENRVMDSYLYELVAIIVHYGNNLITGHYTSYNKIDGEWYLFDDDKITRVPKTIVFKQNPYLLFYKKTKPAIPKLPTPAPVQQPIRKSGNGRKNRRNRGRNKRRGANRNNQNRNLKTSQNITKPLEKAKIPKYRVYYESDETSIKNIIIKTNIRQLDSSISVDISTSGLVTVNTTSPLYSLKLHLPFQLNCETSEAIFFKLDSMLFITIPFLYEESEQMTLKLDVYVNESEYSSSLPIDTDHEIDIKPITDLTMVQSSPVLSKLDEVYIKLEKLNISRKETNYSDLYNLIASTCDTQNLPEDYMNPRVDLQRKEPVKQKKYGRNASCPCGSGRKYKFCHGKP